MKRTSIETFRQWIKHPKTRHYFLEGRQTYFLVSLFACGLNAILLNAARLIVDQSSARAVTRKPTNYNLLEDTASDRREATAQPETEKAISTGVWAPVNRR